MTDLRVDRDEVKRFLGTYYTGAAGLVSICGDGDWPGKAFSSNVVGLVTLAPDHVVAFDYSNPTGIYARPTTVAHELPPGRRGGAEDSAEFFGFWTDLDYAGAGHKDTNLPPDEETAHKVYAESGLPDPTILVRSGGGLYHHVLLNSPVDITDAEMRAEVEALSRRWHAVVAAAAAALGYHYGTGVSDLARVLRIPGTVNRKPGVNRYATAEYSTWRYDLGDLRALLADAEERLDVGAPQAGGLGGVRLDAPVFAQPGTEGPADAMAKAAEWADIFEPHGWERVWPEKSSPQYWKRLGSSHDYSVKAWEHVCVCHSDNAGLPVGKGNGLNKFQTWAWLNHRGDMSEAGRDLRRSADGDVSASIAARRLPPRVLSAIAAACGLDAAGTHGPRPKASHKSQNSGDAGAEANNGFSGLKNEGGHVWEEPIPVEAPRLPALPVDRLGGLAPWVRAQSEALNVAEDIAAFSALSVISAAIGGRRRVQVKEGWTENVCLYLLALADSSARKTPALDAARVPLDESAGKLKEQAAAEVMEHNEKVEIAKARYERAQQAMIKESDGNAADLETARSAVLELGGHRQAPQLIAGGDSTMEYLAKVMSEQGGRVAVLGSEATLYKHATGIYGNGQANIGPLLEGFTGTAYDAGRVSRGAMHMPYTAVTLGLIIQPGMVEGLSKQNPDFKSSGFLNRFLFSLPSPMPPGVFDSPTVPDEVAKTFGNRIRSLVEHVWPAETITHMGLTRAARQAFAQFYNEIEKRRADGGDLHDLGEWSGKLCGQIIRIAACLTLFDSHAKTEIDEPTMVDAIALAPYLTAHARRVLELMDATTEGGRKPLADILTWLGKNTKAGGEVSVRQVWRGLNGRAWARSADTIKEAMAELEDLGWIAEITPEPQHGKRGRKPSPKYALHPHIHQVQIEGAAS